MADPFIGEIRIMGFAFAPRGWAFCNGQVMSIAQNQALFSLLGTAYGGDGVTTFALPNLQGRTPIHWGNGAGLSPHTLGERAGEEGHTLISTEMPAHNHTASGVSDIGTVPAPTGAFLAAEATPIYAPAANLVPLTTGTIATAGSSQAHNNMMAFLTLNFCIALVGIYPSRS